MNLKTTTAQNLKVGDKLIIASKVYPLEVTKINENRHGVTVFGRHNLVTNYYTYKPAEYVQVLTA